MQKGIRPLATKLATDGKASYSVQSAMHLLSEKIAGIRTTDLAIDLLPMFESPAFIQAWLKHFHANFTRYATEYLSSTESSI